MLDAAGADLHSPGVRKAKEEGSSSSSSWGVHFMQPQTNLRFVHRPRLHALTPKKKIPFQYHIQKRNRCHTPSQSASGMLRKTPVHDTIRQQYVKKPVDRLKNKSHAMNGKADIQRYWAVYWLVWCSATSAASFSWVAVASCGCWGATVSARLLVSWLLACVSDRSESVWWTCGIFSCISSV